MQDQQNVQAPGVMPDITPESVVRPPASPEEYTRRKSGWMTFLDTLVQRPELSRMLMDFGMRALMAPSPGQDSLGHFAESVAFAQQQRAARKKERFERQVEQQRLQLYGRQVAAQEEAGRRQERLARMEMEQRERQARAERALKQQELGIRERQARASEKRAEAAMLRAQRQGKGQEVLTLAKALQATGRAPNEAEATIMAFELINRADLAGQLARSVAGMMMLGIGDEAKLQNMLDAIDQAMRVPTAQPGAAAAPASATPGASSSPPAPAQANELAGSAPAQGFVQPWADQLYRQAVAANPELAQAKVVRLDEAQRRMVLQTPNGKYIVLQAP